MNKKYEKPVLITELFDVDDVITVSSAPEHTDTDEDLAIGPTGWEVPLGL